MRAALYTADWVLPVTAPPLAGGAVLVNEHGTIDAIAPAATFQVGDDVARIDLGAALLLPGLINVHTHPELTGMRGLLEDLPFHQWIPTLRRTRERAALDRDEIGVAARMACLEVLAAGITTMAATEDSAASIEALRESGMRGVVFQEVFGPAPAQAAASLAQLRDRVAAARALETERVRIGISPHAPYTVSDQLYHLSAAYALTESLPVAVHIAESETESQLVEHGAGPFAGGLRTRGIETLPRATSPIALLARTGILATRPLLIHCVRVNAGDIHAIADTGAAVAHCPAANARLGNGIAPVLELLEAGVNVAIGTDSVAASNRMDLLEEARLAQLMQRARLRSGGALEASRLLRLITIDAARALGFDARIGSLEVGKDADLCAVSVSSPHTRPAHDPITTLLFSARGSDVFLTAVRGEVLYRDGVFYSLDADRLRHRMDEIGARLFAARQAPHA